MKQLVEVSPPRVIIVKLGPRTFKVARYESERWMRESEPTHIAIYELTDPSFRHEYQAVDSLKGESK